MKASGAHNTIKAQVVGLIRSLWARKRLVDGKAKGESAETNVQTSYVKYTKSVIRKGIGVRHAFQRIALTGSYRSRVSQRAHVCRSSDALEAVASVLSAKWVPAKGQLNTQLFSYWFGEPEPHQHVAASSEPKAKSRYEVLGLMPIENGALERLLWPRLRAA